MSERDVDALPDPSPALTPLAFHILLALVDQPRHGYAIIQDIESRTGGGARLRSGTLYTAIHRLESDGLLEEDDSERHRGGDQRRRYYRITDQGRLSAQAEAHRLSSLLSTARERNLIDWSGA